MSKRSILITGCSSGIGLHAALALKKQGWRVFAAARQAKDVEKLAENGLESIQLDLNDSESIHRAVQQVLSATGGTLDALFNNAGLLVAGAIDDISRDLTRKQFETNVFGPMELIRVILPVMRQQGHGRIIQNSSILGVLTLPYYGAYNASKFALEGFSRTLYQECRGTNIHISIMNPGPISSDLRKNAYTIYKDSVAKKSDSYHQDIYRKLENDYFHKQRGQFLLNGPEAVVKKLNHALTSKHPKLHYFIGWPAQLLAFMQKILPERLFNWLLSKI
ncbi:MAG TPA: SDR family NAD(P)-dependent oxidoreductase [Gammaproteobacteria bacterium]|jgi:NAD(P)-dependent dehydrogenase (short-subunit alcohol dehydrogenase family)|nr:SDR family NAD(P)-dependent oxidoreductase [Gammaproteobacteria bacterium]